jgi:enoyl-CoA hydratase/carnithine racemase
MVKLLLEEQHGRVSFLRFNRPERDNRISADLATELTQRLLALDADPAVGVVVLGGVGPVFCLGGDHTGSGPTTADHLTFTKGFATLATTVLQLGKPVLAAVHGHAHAGGFSLLTCCDYAVMADDATLALPEIEFDLFPILAMALVLEQLPRKLFFDLVYNARHLSASESVQLGLANQSVPRDEVVARTLQKAQEIAARHPVALRIGRQSYQAMSGMGLDAALQHARYILPTLMAAVKGYEPEGASQTTDETAP